MAVRGRPRAFDREHALNQAMEVFWQRGYEGASIIALTEAMGISPPSLYASFLDKEGLFKEALNLYLRDHGSYRDETLNSAPTAREGVERILKRTLEYFFLKQPPRGCLVVLAALAGTPDSQEIQDELSNQRNITSRLIATRIENGVLAGELPVTCQVGVLATFYSTVLFGLTIRAKDQVSYGDLLASVDVAMQAWPIQSRGKSGKT